jgi:integrase
MAHIQDRWHRADGSRADTYGVERRWQARYRDPDGEERSKTFRRKLDARRWLDEKSADMLTGRYVDPSAGRVTFREYAELWRASQPHRPSTEVLYERLLRLHVYPTIGDRRLSSVRRSDVQGWVASLSDQLAPASVQGAYSRVRTIFRTAVDDRLIAETPCRNIALPEIVDETLVPLTTAQVKQLAEATPDDLEAMVVFGAGTGLRSGELLGLTVESIDFLRREVTVERQLVYIPGQGVFLAPPKTKASVRTVPVPDYALEAVAEHLRRYPPVELEIPWGDVDADPVAVRLVFLAPKGGPILRTTLNGRWAKMAKRAGVPQARPHDLRHHYASVLIDGGESVKVVQERLGHASATETLDTYSHLWPSSDERTRSVVERAWIDAPAERMRNAEGQ